MSKRVVILSAFLSPFRSGAEACTEEVALRLRDQFDITIITAKLRKDLPRRDLLQGKVLIFRVGLGMGIDKWLYPFLAPFAARKLRPDVIHAVLETFAGLALLCCKLLIPRTERILTLQTTNRSFLRRMIVRAPHHVTAISSILVKDAEKIRNDRVTLIPNGIAFAEMRAAAEKIGMKTTGRILFVGRLEKVKGVDMLLKAFEQLSRHSEATGARLRIVGDGSQREALEKAAGSLLINELVTFTGKLTGEDLLREYAQAEIFCGLSRSEAQGNVFLEAQAAGCAVIATNVGGIPETVIDGKTGLLVPVDNAVAAEAAMLTLLKDLAARQMLGKAGIENARKYDWDGIAERYAHLYDA